MSEFAGARIVRWIGSSRADIREFPDDVQHEIGFALYQAQCGRKHDSAKPLKGFKDAGVLEIVASHDGNAYRAVYTVRFRAAVYVLHAFQKKSKKGIQTPKAEMDLVIRRLNKAAEDYKENYENEDD